MGAAANIALGPWSRESRMPGQMGMPDPMEMANQAMDLRNKQAQWQSQQNLTNILNASHGDANAARALISQDPMAAWMLPQVETWERAGLLAQQNKTQTFEQSKIAADTAGVTLKNGIELNIHSLRMAGGNPDNFNNYMDAGLAGMARTNPTAAAELSPLVHSLKQAATGDLEGLDQGTKNRIFTQRTFTGLVGNGTPHDDALAITTGVVPFHAEVGGQLMGGVAGAAPGTVGGIQLIPPGTPGAAAGPMPDVGAGIGGGLGVGGGGGTGAGGGRIQLQPPQQQQPAQPQPQAQPVEYKPAPMPWEPPEVVLADRSGDGTELYTHGSIPETGYASTTLRGPTGFALNKAQQTGEDAAMAEYRGKDTQEFQAAQATLGQIQTVDADINALHDNGGWMTPGTRLPARARFAATLNTIASSFGLKPVFDQNNVAAAESLNKQLETMAMEMAKSAFGGQREAAVTYQRIASTVPGMENTFAGTKLLLAGIKATAQRAIDLRNFKDQWLRDQDHGNTMWGAEEAFNQMHPVNEYVSRALAPFGLDASLTFPSGAALKQAVLHDIVSKTEAIKILHKNPELMGDYRAPAATANP